MEKAFLRNVPRNEILAEIKIRQECEKMPKATAAIIGKPGTGKTTQAMRISKNYCWCYISIPQLLFREIHKNSEKSEEIREILQNNEMVSDKIVLDLIGNYITEPICSRGIVFDGFPRTISQIVQLDRVLKSKKKEKVSKVIELESSQDNLLKRLIGKRVHLPSGRVYHTKFNRPLTDEIDDFTSEPLSQPSHLNFDEKLKAYTKIAPVFINYFKRQRKYIKIDGNKDINAVWKSIHTFFTIS